MQLISVLSFPLLLTLIKASSAELVIVYDHNAGEGDFEAINVQSCTALPRGWTYRVSSIRLEKDACVEVHASRMCAGAASVVVSNSMRGATVIDLDGAYDFNDKALALKRCSFVTRSAATANWESEYDFDASSVSVTLFEFVNRKGTQANVRFSDCRNVPRTLYKNIASLDTRENCVRLYAGPSCSGESVQIQPTDAAGSSNLAYWNFLDKIASVGACAEYQMLALTLQNKLRERYNVPELEMDERLNQDAQAAAETLANQSEDPQQTVFTSGFLTHWTDRPTSASTLVQAAFSAWPSTRLTYDSRNPVPSPFTQLIAENTERFGIGFAKSTRRSVIVAKYSPVGNAPFAPASSNLRSC